MVILFFAITGSPLFGPFVSEFQILCGAFATDRIALGIAFLVLLLIVFFGMGSVLLGVMLGPAEEASSEELAGQAVADKQRFHESLLMVSPIVLVVVLTLLLGVYTPPFLADWTHDAAEFLQQVPVEQTSQLPSLYLPSK